MNNIEFFFNSYNSSIANGYNKAITDKGPEGMLKLKESEIDIYVNESIEDWANKPFAELEQYSPKNYIESISSFNELIEFFKYGSIICDKGLPYFFIEKINSFGDEAVDAMISMAADKKYMLDEEKIFISIMAIKSLGILKISRAIPNLIDIVKNCDPDLEIILENAIDSLICIGKESIPLIINSLKDIEVLSLCDEYILTALVKIGQKHKSDEIYQCIKNSFLISNDKVLVAMCIADYGDGRAIPMLRGYIEKNKDCLEKNTYLEVKRAIKKLGGDISDI